MIGNVSHEAVLLQSLADTDSDVRIEAVKALALIGTRQAVPAIRQVKDGKDFAGHSIEELISPAIDAINQRHPLSAVQKVVCCRELTTQQQPVRPVTLFFPDTPVIHCVANLDDPGIGSSIACRAIYRQLKPKEDVILHPVWSLEPKALSTNLIFSFIPPKGRTWQPGSYTFEVLLDGKVQQKTTIKVVRYVSIKDAMTCSDVGRGRDGTPAHKQTTFMAGIQNLYCSATIEEAPIGFEVKGRVFRIEKRPRKTTSPKAGIVATLLAKKPTEPAATEVFVAESKVTTVIEGTQSIVISWKSPAGWQVGDYC